MDNFRKDLIKIMIGNILLAVGYGCITIPNQIVDGGMTSFALIIAKMISMDVSIVVNVFTLLLLAVSLWKLGKDNFFKTLISSIGYLVLLDTVRSAGIKFIMHPVLVVIIASIVVGLGFYFCVSANASTAGFDTVAVIINRKNPKIEIGTSLRYISIFVLVMGFASLGWRAVIYGIVFSILESQTINIMIRLEKKAREFKNAKKEGKQNLTFVPEVF